MSCQVKLTSTIADVPAIRRCLFPMDDLRGSDSWLQLCEASVSPTGDLIALANDKRLVVLTSKWDSSNSLNRYEISFSGCVNDDDAIKAVLCLPVVIQSQSSQVGPEWSCIAVGFESGFVRFYTEDCKLLFGEQFHNEIVCGLKCQSQHSPRPDLNFELKPEELYVQYVTNVCNINGNQLFTLLRNRREQLLKGVAQSEGEQTITAGGFKKWGFQDQFAVNDIAMVGLDLANTFDHLLTASTCGGYDTRYRAMAPHNNLVMGAGSKPFVGFHYALEGGTQPVLTDVAKAVASKLKSALPGWLTGNKNNVEKQMTLALQPAETMGCRFGMCDLRRTAFSIILSPDRRLALVIDVLSRISLIDTHRGVVLRMFKGYRDAQSAFIQVPDEKRSKHRSHNKVATFIVIYAPKKGTLEIFTAQNGSKIATFTASKYSVLLYINYGLLGFTATSKSRYVCGCTCVFIDPDGLVKEIVIPFHFALTEKNSKRARDLHLYKRLKQFFKSSEHLSEEEFTTEALNTCSEIKTPEVELQCLQMLAGCKEVYPNVITQCTQYFLTKYRDIEPEELNSDVGNVCSLSERLSLLSGFYLFIQASCSDELDVENGNASRSDGDEGTKTEEAEDTGGRKPEELVENPKAAFKQATDSKLCLSDRIIANLQKLLDLSTLDLMNKPPEPKVSFVDNKFTFADYISAFDLLPNNEKLRHKPTTLQPDKLRLKPNLEAPLLLELAGYVFSPYVTGRKTNFSEFEAEVKKINVAIRDLFKMILSYWVDRPLHTNVHLETEMNNLSQLIYILSKLEDTSTVEYNQTSPFWTEIREFLANSARPFPALTSALICRSVAQRIEHERELQQSATSLEDENIEIWEKLSQENCEWMLLIGKLEDVSLLNVILSNRPYVSDSEHCTLPKLKHNSVDVSLRYVLEKGRGAVSELVARWLTSAGVEPRSIASAQVEPDEARGSTATSFGHPEPLFDHLGLIKKQFPYSLDPSVLLANMCWEYAIAWQKELQEFTYLESAIRCLNAIPQPHIKQGMCNLVWNTHLKIIFESACKLINKVGKLPKEKLCKQDTGLTDREIMSFIVVCTEFLDAFLEVVQESYNSQRVALTYENIWENGGKPLADLALQQTHINYELLHVHYQLSLTIRMITRFTIKQTKIVSNLFDPTITSLFFTDLQQKTQISWNKSDTKTHAARTQFLLKIISASIETVTNTDDRIYSADHVSWMSQCVSLARVWNLDVDLLRRFQVAQLFSNGFDSVAEELLSSLSELSKLGPDLLRIAGKRLHHLLASGNDLSEKITALSPALTQYLDSLNEDWCAPSSLEGILLLGTHCVRCLDENQTEYRIACQLLEACCTLQDLER